MPQVHETVKISFYDVTKCGYFSYAKSKSDSFCTLGDVLKELYGWIHQTNMTLGQTLTFQPADDEEDLPVYCYDIVKHINGDFLLVTWNATPSINNQVSAVKGTGLVGSAEITTKNFDEDDIPGYATYFWFLPNEGSFATIRFNHLVNGQAGMCKYMLGYLQNLSSHVYKDENASGDFDTYYKKDTNDNGHYYPSFSTARKRLPGQVELIKSNRANIVKVINSSKLEPMLSTDQMSFFQSALSLMGIKTPAVQREEIEIKNEMKMTPTKDELDSIILNWEGFQTNGSFDVGFSFKGDSNQVHWLSRSIAKTEIEIIFDRQDGNNEIATASSLLDALISKKGIIQRLAIHE